MPLPARRDQTAREPSTLCGIDYGLPLVFAAAASEQVMVVRSAATIASMLTAHYTHVIETEYPAPVPDRESESPDTP
ncbi:hypothetical protein [Actinophytocola sp.]|uniref:hypothetical protein n=1 Tax=Actinophytocola sp. TaxID=1872138 RepID=UPI003899961E